LLQGATALFVAGKYADAQVQFQHFLDSYQDDSLAAQAALGVAACLDAQGKTDAAVSAYKNVIGRYSDGDVLAEAKFALARVYYSQGEFAPARDIYKDVALAYPYNSLGQEAAVRAEELKLPAKPALVNPANLGNFLSFTTNSSIPKPNQH
jgi:TolA-binding protein